MYFRIIVLQCLILEMVNHRNLWRMDVILKCYQKYFQLLKNDMHILL